MSKRFTNSLTTAPVRSGWRIAIICAIEKNSDPEDVSNYHGVSLTPTSYLLVFNEVVTRIMGEGPTVSEIGHFRRCRLAVYRSKLYWVGLKST